jgi:putative membrane protein
MNVMARLRGLPYRAWLLVVVLLALLAAGIKPHSRTDYVLEHIPTLTGLGFVAWLGVRRPLSNAAYTLLAVFLLLHILGSHFLYSRVPYDEWSRAVFGTSVSEAFGLERNHYDRLIHFLFGVLITPVMAEIAVRSGRVKAGFWAVLTAVGVVAICGNVYEVLEWLLALVASPEAAEDYNGQQGDVFDAPKDMALNFSGAVMSGAVVWWRGAMKR